MAKILTFVEIMLRLAPNGYYHFFQNDQMQATFGGGLIYSLLSGKSTQDALSLQLPHLLLSTLLRATIIE